VNILSLYKTVLDELNVVGKKNKIKSVAFKQLKSDAELPQDKSPSLILYQIDHKLKS
jgi:hypothetical protein